MTRAVITDDLDLLTYPQPISKSDVPSCSPLEGGRPVNGAKALAEARRVHAERRPSKPRLTRWRSIWPSSLHGFRRTLTG
jgi:hypothetical protein